MGSLVVLTGAGASYDCVSANIHPHGTRPPLTKDLFGPEFKPTLNRYPLVRQAAGEIRRVTTATGDDALLLEAFLRERMLNSPSPHTQRRYRQVPLYLQDVLTQASAFTDEPDNYNALVNAALEAGDALFLTLNYDTILDSRLKEYHSIEEMDWYVNADPHWTLVKLHGSVDWGWRIALEGDQQATPTIEMANLLIDQLEALPRFDNDDIRLRKHQDVRHRRLDGAERAVYYPALAVPLGEDDALVCPATHIEAAQAWLESVDGVNLVVIGYSGLDREVRRLLSQSGNSIRSMLVANGSSEASRAAAERIADAFGIDQVQDDWLFDGGFTDVVVSGDLQRWVSNIVAR